ncbi:threonine synthase [Paenibacillus baimaensis]|nr:threonine synthase [Paenibacillus sp. WQ 127069]
MVKKGGIREGNLLKQNMLERYADFFPYFNTINDVSLREGFSPLLESEKLANEIGLGKLYLKNESSNPTWSFKDRGTVTGVLHAIKIGYKKIATVSSGNMAASVAAYGAKSGLKTYVFVSSQIPIEKINPIAIYNPTLVTVEGRYDLIQRQSLRLSNKYGIYMLNSDATFRVEGYKSLAFEICEQTNFDVPDYVLVPNSSGGHIRGIEKGFREFKECGLIKKVPKMVCVQAAGCSPVYNAFIAGADKVERIDKPNTLAHGIENALPLSGNQVLRMLKWNNGLCVSVTDEEIINAQATLAGTGLLLQPESAATLAAVKKLKKEKYFRGDEKVLCVLTGSGLKYTAAFERHELEQYTCKLDEMDSLLGSLQ